MCGVAGGRRGHGGAIMGIGIVRSQGIDLGIGLFQGIGVGTVV